MGEIRVKTADGWSTKPAHKKTSTGWQDIPTHTMTANGWQGELTSQSPLRFRADGEMLDWRVEGKTSENLFDVKHFVDTAYCHNVVLTQLDNGMKIQATSSDDPYANYVNGVIGQTLSIDMRSAVIPCEPNTDYTLRCVQSSRLGKYISYFDKDYKVVKNYTPFSGTPLNFKTPETCVFILLRLGDRSTLSEGTAIELTNIQLLEGTYTASTIPPYEPYGGVGNWDETEQKYRIPITVEGENLFDTSVYTNNTYLHNCTVTNTSTSVTITSTGTDPFVGFVNSPGTTVPERAQLMYIPVKPNTTYTINMSSAPKCYCTQVDESNVIKKNTQINRLPYSFTTDKSTTYVIIRLGDDTLQVGESRIFEDIQLLEGTYTSSTIPPYEVNIYTDHQLMDGDSIDYTTTETTIPLATGNNTLTVDTAVKPKSVFVKFEG